MKISETEPKYFTTSDFNKFTHEIPDVKIKEKELVNKSDICGSIDTSDLDKKIATLAAKVELKADQDKIVKLQAFDSTCFRCKNNFKDDGMQNY